MCVFTFLNSHDCVTGVPRTSNSSINLFISNCTVHLQSTRNKVMTSVVVLARQGNYCGIYSCFTCTLVSMEMLRLRLRSVNVSQSNVIYFS